MPTLAATRFTVFDPVRGGGTARRRAGRRCRRRAGGCRRRARGRRTRRRRCGRRCPSAAGSTTSCAATRRSTVSPAAWPWVSLTCLNRSRSTKNTAVHRPERFEWDRAWSMRSTSSARFGRPVSASWVACLVSAACASCRSAIRSAWARLSRAISRSWAFWALRSVNVRQVRSVAVDVERRAPDQHRDRARRRCRRGRARRWRRARPARGSRPARSGGRRRRTSPAATRRSSLAGTTAARPVVGWRRGSARSTTASPRRRACSRRTSGTAGRRSTA